MHQFLAKKHNLFLRSTSVIVSRAKIKSVKMTLVIIACYILCSTPFIVGQLLATLGPHHISSKIGLQMEPLFWLMTLNSLVNPWIYIWFNRNQFFYRSDTSGTTTALQLSQM